MKRLHRKGLGTSSKQAEPITPDEESPLWTSGQLGTHSAKALLNTVKFLGWEAMVCSVWKKNWTKKDESTLTTLTLGARLTVTHESGEQNNENMSDPDHCVVNIFVRYFDFIPNRDEHFYFRSLPDDGSGIPRNTRAQLIPAMCKVAGIPGRKTGRSGKVTCATTLYHQNFSDQLIKELLQYLHLTCTIITTPSVDSSTSNVSIHKSLQNVLHTHC